MSDLERQLETAMAEVGRLIEEIPWDERHDRVWDFMVRVGYIDPSAPSSGAYLFLIGTFVSTHARRLDSDDPSVLRERAEALIAAANQIEARQCTELSAAWCPVHGGCVCDRENSLDDQDCPLHSVQSIHAASREDRP